MEVLKSKYVFKEKSDNENHDCTTPLFLQTNATKNTNNRLTDMRFFRGLTNFSIKSVTLSVNIKIRLELPNV